MLRKQIEKKFSRSDANSPRYSDFALDSELEPRELMEKLTEELAQKVLKAFAGREKISN
jgi:hypothetical protein